MAETEKFTVSGEKVLEKVKNYRFSPKGVDGHGEIGEDLDERKTGQLG